MAGGMQIDNAGRGGKKPLDSAINLVPFIDMMAVTISFLIMTAVWNQIGRLQVNQRGGPPTDPRVQPPETISLNLTMTERGFTLEVSGAEASLPKKSGQFDYDGLGAELRNLKERFPEQQAMTIVAEDAIRYEDLVKAIDHCIGSGLSEISITPATG